jgi:hypothetical protein
MAGMAATAATTTSEGLLFTFYVQTRNTRYIKQITFTEKKLH